MPKLPSTQDLARPTPQPTRSIVQPSLVGVEGRAIEKLGSNVAQVGEVLVQAQQRIRNRSDTINRLRLIRGMRQFSQNELLSASTQDDFETPEAVNRYAQTINQKASELFAQHPGLPESKAFLIEEFERIKGKFILNASRLSGQAQLDLLNQEMAVGLEGLKGQAFETPGQLPEILLQWQDMLKANSNAFPTKDDIKFELATSEIVKSAVDGLLIRGEHEAADRLLDNIKDLVGENKIRANITTARNEMRKAGFKTAAQIISKIKTIEAMTGEKLTAEQIQREAGFTGDPNSTQLKMAINKNNPKDKQMVIFDPQLRKNFFIDTGDEVGPEFLVVTPNLDADLDSLGLGTKDQRTAAKQLRRSAADAARIGQLLNKTREFGLKTTGIRGAAATYLGGALGNLNENAEKEFNRLIGAATPEEVAAWRAEARTVIASLVRETTGDEGKRISDVERRIAEDTLRLLELEASPAQITAAVAALLKLKVLSVDRDRFNLLGEAGFSHDLSTHEGRKARAKELAPLGFNSSQMIGVIQDQMAQRRELRQAVRVESKEEGG